MASSSIDRRPNGTYRARWREYPGGPQRSKTFARKEDARQHLVRIQHDLLTGAYVDPTKGRTTVAEYYAAWSARQPWRQSTRRAVRISFDVHVLPVFGDRPIGTVRRGDVEAWSTSLDMAASTAGLRIQHLSAMFEAAVADGLVAKNPVHGAKRPTVVRAPVVPFTADQIARLRAAAPPWFAVAVDLGAQCGLRQGEAAGLTVDRVDFLRRQLKVDRQLVTSHERGSATTFGPPKTARSFRTVPLGDATATALAAHVQRFGTGEDGLLLHEDGAAVGLGRFGHVWSKRTRTVARLPAARFHNLRHTYASVLLAGGVSVAAAAEYLGDTPAVLLAVYAHLMPADHDRARGAVEAAFAQRTEDSLRTDAGS